MNKAVTKVCSYLLLMERHRFFLRILLLLIISIIFPILLNGCHVGPDFAKPLPPKNSTYTNGKVETHLTAGNDEPSQNLITCKEIPVAWWQLFHSPSLNKIVNQAIANNLSIEAAKAKLAQSQQSILMAQGEFYPQIDFALSAQREKGPPLAFGLAANSGNIPTYNLYSLGPTVSFVPDAFGLTRRQVEQQAALAENQSYQLAAAQLTVTGNVVAEALTIASVRQQMQAIKEIVADDEKTLNLVQRRLRVGSIDRTDLLSAENQLDKDRASLPPLKQQIAAAENALAILVGKSPAEWEPPCFNLDEFTLPKDLPLIIPSKLVSRRPDIMAAEAELHANSAAIGIATGELFPTITLSSLLAPTALTPSMLFQRSNLAWDIAASVSAPIFHGGTLKAQKRAAIDAYQASLATYRQTVLEGLRQVADVLRALSHDSDLVREEHRALNVSKRSLMLTRAKFTVGTVNMLQLLDTQRSYNEALVSYTRACAQRYLDSANLFVALGGGLKM